jgi:hypothetical protein
MFGESKPFNNCHIPRIVSEFRAGRLENLLERCLLAFTILIFGA